MKKVIYGWSFDPITYGHKNVIERAAKHFEHLTVGIGVNESKEGKYLFSLQERLYLVREVIKDILNADVVAYRGMTTTFAKENEYDLLIRWIRNAKDFDEEQMLDQAFKRQDKWFDTFYLNAQQAMQDLSSSAAKNVLSVQWDIRDYVAMIVKQAMEGRLLGQYFAGVTGTVGSWKSYTTEQFLAFCKKNGIPAHHLDLDKIGHEIQWITLQEPIYQTARNKIIQLFGNEVANQDGSINRRNLGPKVFSDAQKMSMLNDIMREPMEMRTNRLITNQKWLFLYNAALIAEAGTSSKVNNNVILVNVPAEIQAERLTGRWLNAEEIQKRISSQLTTEHKRALLSQAITKDQHGKIIDLQSPYNWQDSDIAFNNMLAQIDTFGELRFAWLLNRLWVKEDAKKSFTDLRNTYDRPIDPEAKRDEIAQKIKWSYHKRLHIVDCMNELYEVKHLLENPDAVECALLFHDVIYDPANPAKNEEESAAYAEKTLTQRWLPKSFIKTVKQLILATKPWAVPKTNDSKYIKDIDMSIFGRDDRKYTQYAKDVRREYYMFSDEQFKKWRGEFLLSLIKKKNIYQTEYFTQKYGTQVEKNIFEEVIRSDQKSS